MAHINNEMCEELPIFILKTSYTRNGDRMKPDQDNMYKNGVALITAGRVQEGLKVIRQLAKAGHAPSQRGLGVASMHGQFGLPVDYVDAAYWFTEATKKNDALSFYNLGLMFFDGMGVQPDMARAFAYFKQSAEAGYVDAQLIVADYHFFGKFVKNDRQVAEKYYLKANQQGNAHATFMLALIKLFDPREDGSGYKESKKLSEQCYGSPKDAEARTIVNLLNAAMPKQKHEKVWDLGELMKKISKEHDSNIYYRGQTTFYGQPLCPSVNRLPHSIFPVRYEGPARLRGTGRNFYFEDSFREQPVANKVKWALSRYLNNAFGYPLTQALFQQAGYQSEGIDITADLIMALFFSTYDYDINKGTFYIDETKNQSVLYRWRNLKPAKNILQQDYYSCHNLIPTYDILKSFGSCYTTDEFNQSLIAYAHAIQWDYKFDLQSIRSKRPHHLIKIPKHLLVNSRINKQKGYLLLPDVIIAEPQAQAETYLPPRYMKNLPLRLLQDLSEEGFCEIFIYKRDNALAKKMLADNNITPQEIYNEEKEDLSHLLLYNWFESIYKKVFDYGVMPVVEDPVEDFSYVDILHHLNTWQKKKQRAGYYFETAVG